MCGICGIAGLVDVHLIQVMTDLIAHRGPDDAGIWLSSPDDKSSRVGLGNRRLSIQDLSRAGHMPMASADGATHLTYNGEVYNFRVLRSELEAQGIRFRSNSDTEVLINLYERDGVQFLSLLNGMFAFGLWDETRRQLLLARDRYGIKPLYYTTVAGQSFLFASEIKSLLADSRVPRAVDLEALDSYLRFGWVPGPKTLFRGIFKLPPANYLTWRDGDVDIRPFWEARYEEPTKWNERDLVDQLASILDRAVARHLISDVPVGVLLSGGLDSTTILALAARLTPDPVQAYTISFRPEDAVLEQAGQEDARNARNAASYYHASYHEIVAKPDIAELLPEVVYALDEPVSDHAPILTLLIARAAYPDVKVLLTGQGADEVFGGYRVHVGAQVAGLLGRLPEWARVGPLSSAADLLAALPLDAVGISKGRRLAAGRFSKRILEGAGLSAAERYARARSYYSREEQLRLYAPEVRNACERFDVSRWHRGYYDSAAGASALNRMLYTDLKTFLPELNLTYSDKLTAFASVEGRVPFLDNEIVDFAAKLPPRMKLHDLTGKYLLRKAVHGLVPERIINRPKAGFGAPVRKWLRDELRPMVHDLLSADVIRRRGYFDPDAIDSIVTRNETGIDDQPMRVWTLLVLELWHRVFMDASLGASRPTAVGRMA